MKNRFAPRPATLCLLFVSLAGVTSGETRQYWNPPGGGGDGIWGSGLAEKNWNLVAGAATGNTFWQDGIDDVAVFRDAVGGIVTVNDTVQTAGIVQDGMNYTINAGIIVLAADSAANAPFINVLNGTLAIDSQLAGSDGLVKTGAGTLLLSSANPFTGPTVIEGGTLELTGSLASTGISISAGAGLLNQNGGLSTTATLTNAGSLTLGANDTIANYVSNGGTLTTGAGTLFTTTAELNDGSTVAGLLNAGTLTSNGAVLLSGTATAGSAIVSSGTLRLDGTLAANDVTITSGATLWNWNGGLSNDASLVNSGTLTMSAQDTISSYVSNGGTLGGHSSLTTVSSTLNGGSTVEAELRSVTIVTNGDVLLIAGVIGNTVRATDSLTVESGTLTSSGSIQSPAVTILAGATLLNEGNIIGPGSGAPANTILTNEGTFVSRRTSSIHTYLSNGGHLEIEAQRMISVNAFLNDGSTTAGLSFSSDLLVSNGNVMIGGSALGGDARIESGVLTLNGRLNFQRIEISSGATVLNNNAGLGPSALVTNAGTLRVEEGDAIHTYLSSGGTLAAGPGILSADTAALNDGSTIAGLLNAQTLTSNGAVLLSGTATAGSASIQTGTLTLSGSLVSDTVGIADGATLLNQNGGLSPTATLTNAGSLALDADDTVASYISNGGTLTAGPGTLFSTSTTLNDGSTIAGLLNSNTLTSHGSVQITGTVSAENMNIASGTLTNTGTFGSPTSVLNLNEGATLVANGLQQYALLTTSGTGAANWLGDLNNTTTIAPGGMGEVGILAVDGNFTQSPSGILNIDLSAAGSDLLAVSGTATFGGTLELNQSGAAIAPFVPVTVVSAAAYGGNIASLSENLDGTVWFNPGNGTVTRIAFPTGGGSLFGATLNQTSTWISLYDDVVDPGVTNITSGPAGYGISSGIADAGNPDLLWALTASFTPGGLNAPLLNRLSPEVYGGLSDYAMQATRAHQRSALSAPPLMPRDGSMSDIGSSAKSGPKGGIESVPPPSGWEFFAAVDHFRAGSDNSRNQADYELDGMGILAGARAGLLDRTQLAVYFGADSGTINGELIDGDAFGWTFGLIGEHLLHEPSRTRLRAGVSYGSYEFDGTRGSASATAAGWAPGMARFDDVGVGAFDLFVGVDSVVWKQDVLTLIPSAGLRYAMTKMSSFGETTGGFPGSPIALNVGRDRHEALLLELGMLGRVEVSEVLALWAEGGFNIGLLDNDRVLAARFAQGERTMRARAAGLDDDSLYLGFGAAYQFTDSKSAALGYRADIRSGADAQHEVRLSTSWRF